MGRFYYYILIFVFVTLYGCTHKAFTDDKFVFSDKFRCIINPYKVGDTLKYENESHQSDMFIITKEDSIIQNENGWFINARPFKYISIHYRQLSFKQRTNMDINRNDDNSIIKKTISDDALISLNIYPDNGEESCFISFKNFRGHIEKGNDSIFLQPIIASNMRIVKYYKVENYDLSLVKNATDIKTIYITDDKRIIAYQDQNNNCWTKTN